MRKQKEFMIDVSDYNSAQVADNDSFYTRDTDAYLIFRPTNMHIEYDSALLHLTNMATGATLLDLPTTKIDNYVEFKLTPDILRAYGAWKGQILFQLNESTAASSAFEFTVNRFLTDSRPATPVEIVTIDDIRKDARGLMNEAGELIDDITTTHQEITQAEAQRVSAESARVSAEEQRKTDHANRSAEFDGKADKVVLKNVIKNGDFANGLRNWRPQAGFEPEVINQKLTVPKIDSMYYQLYQTTYPIVGNIYYMAVFILENTGDGYIKLRMGAVPDDVEEGYTGLFSRRIEMSDTNGNFIIQFHRGFEGILDNKVFFLDLTQTFGAGNEPTKKEMDELIKITGYIDGEYALNNKEMLGYLMKGIGEKADKKQEDWITPTLLNGWTGEFRYRKNSIGQVEYQAEIVVGTGDVGTRVMIFPVDYRNGLGMHIVHAFDGSSGSIFPMRFRTNGEAILLIPFTTGRTMHLSGVYSTD